MTYLSTLLTSSSQPPALRDVGSLSMMYSVQLCGGSRRGVEVGHGAAQCDLMHHGGMLHSAGQGVERHAEQKLFNVLCWHTGALSYRVMDAACHVWLLHDKALPGHAACVCCSIPAVCTHPLCGEKYPRGRASSYIVHSTLLCSSLSCRVIDAAGVPHMVDSLCLTSPISICGGKVHIYTCTHYYDFRWRLAQQRRGRSGW
jgi:hypothetical protein